MERETHDHSGLDPARQGPRRRALRRRRARLLRAPPDGFAREALKLGRSWQFRGLVRAGFFARGLTYGVIGVIAAALALGAGSEPGSPNQEGALTVIAGVPLGRGVLVVLSVGLLAYALWKLTRGVFGVGPEGGGGSRMRDRFGDLGGGAAYLAFAAAAVQVLVGGAGNQSREQRSATAGVLAWPGGALVVGAAGAGLIAVSAYQAYAAVRGEFRHDNNVAHMSDHQRRMFLVLGRIGLTARALVFALVGYFLVRTAFEFKTEGAIGLDGALAQVHQRPFGPWLLGLVAVGFVIFAAFSFFEARFQRL